MQLARRLFCNKCSLNEAIQKGNFVYFSLKSSVIPTSFQLFHIWGWCSNDGMTSEWQGWEWKNAIFSQSFGIARDDQNEPGIREIGIPRSFSSFWNKVIPRSSQTTQNEWNDNRMTRMTSEWWNEIGMRSDWWNDIGMNKMTSEWMEWHQNEWNDIGMMEKGENEFRLMEWH